MRIGIMQPYLFPYIGYFQLMNKVDKFIFLDDVNFINKGWINRNRLIISGEPRLFTIPLKNASQNRKINEIEISREGYVPRKILKSIEESYRQEKYYKSVNPIISRVLLSDSNLISDIAKHSIINVAKYLGITTEIVWSSSYYNQLDLKGQERILGICGQENATEYWNLPGGSGLYEENLFKIKGVKLNFVGAGQIEPVNNLPGGWLHLSILDNLMRLSISNINKILSI